MSVVNEQNLIEKMRPSLPTNPRVVVGPGDDCAVLNLGLTGLTLMAVDQVVADVHYRAEATNPAEVAVKLLNRNLSDVAAMGGTPTHAVVAVASRETREEWYLDFFRALGVEAEKWNVSVCGGDLSATKRGDFVASLTILGEVEPDKLCLRSEAGPGDAILLTGRCGGALASGRHLSFAPRLREGRFLAGTFTRAMIDVSDGVLIDLNRMCQASRVGAVLDLDAIPAAEGADAAAALTDGEDYELLFAVNPDRRRELLRSWPFENVPLTEIGRFVQGPPFETVDSTATALRETLGIQSNGHDHFKA